MLSATSQLVRLDKVRRNDRAERARNLKEVRDLLCERLERAIAVGVPYEEVREQNLIMRDEPAEEDRTISTSELNRHDELKRRSSNSAAIDEFVLGLIKDSQTNREIVGVGSTVLCTIDDERCVCILTPHGVATQIDNYVILREERLSATFVSLESPLGKALNGRIVDELFRYSCSCGVCEAVVLEIA